MADISKITLPSGSTYDIKDATARQSISDIQSSITGAMHYRGVTTTALTDGSTTATLTIDEASVTFTASDAGSVVIYGEKEYVWNGTKWQEFGSTGSLKALAFEDRVRMEFTPQGSVSQPTFTGNEMTSTGNYTPEGTVALSAASVVAEGYSIAVSPTSGTATYTPAGKVALTIGTAEADGPLFYIQPGNTVSGQPSYTPAGTVSLAQESSSSYPFFYIRSGDAVSGQPSYTPSGTISLTLAPEKTAFLPITNVGSLPTLTATVANETLSLGWDAGALPTAGASTEAITGFSEATATFTGNAVALKTPNLKTTFTGNAVALKTPRIKSSFTGTGVRLMTGPLKAEFTGTGKTVSVSGTPTGTVSKPTFTGTNMSILSELPTA